MKTFTKLFFIPLFCVCSFMISCGNSDEIDVKTNEHIDPEEPEDPTIENTVSVLSSQTSVALTKGVDTYVPISVELKKLAKKDIIVNLSVETLCKEGTEYALDNKKVTIKEGTKVYKGVLTLKSNGFDEDVQKEIKIKIEGADLPISTKNKEITIYVEKPSLFRPGITYSKPTYQFACTAYCSRVSIGGIAFEKMYETQDAYEDLSAQYIACVTPGENKLIIETDRASASSVQITYDYKIVVFGDWNGDGDFDDEKERAVSENWTQGEEQYVIHELKFNVPETAVKSAVIRLGIYQNTDKSVDMNYGAGRMDNGNLKDVSYLLVNTPVSLKSLDEADQPVYTEYCKTVEFFYQYASVRTFMLNGKSVLESTKGDPTTGNFKQEDDYSGKWNAYGNRRQLKYVQKVKKNTQNVFEFTAERHIDSWSCDQRYRAMIYVDWNGDNDFCDDGEEVLQEEWFCEWLASSQPKQFLGYLTPPSYAVKSSRIRFGIYTNNQSYIKGGCGGGNNTDVIDIMYELVD
ncbi:MAG: GEVED domain-containing protein [Rikenellaceae bacterium]